MGTYIDKFLIFVILIAIFDFILKLLHVDTLYIFLITILLTTLIIVSLLLTNTKNKNTYSYREFIIECIKNEDFLKSFITEELYKDYSFQNFDNYFLLNNKPYYLNLKFAPIGYENLMNIYKLAKKNNFLEITIITTIKDRKVLNLSKYLDMSIKIMDLHPIYKKLKKLHLLTKEQKKHKYYLPNILLNIINKNNIKYYVISSIFMFLLSFLTFYKTYYTVFAFVMLIIALICIVVNKMFDKQNYL